MRKPRVVLMMMLILVLTFSLVNVVRRQLMVPCTTQAIEIAHMLVAGCR
jgi:hypothetical protein